LVVPLSAAPQAWPMILIVCLRFCHKVDRPTKYGVPQG
jgi:hypothetical protein